MKRFVLQLLAASSLLLTTAGSRAATRPQYGGTLHVAVRMAPASLDPAAEVISVTPQGRNLSRLLFDTLVTTDDFGRLQPALATSWESDSNFQRWQFRLRNGVKFDDGSALTADFVASLLKTSNKDWAVSSVNDAIVIQLSFPDPDLAAELAQSNNAIFKRLASKVSGTGPFRVSSFEPSKKLTLAANEDYWSGRPFLDSIEIEFGVLSRDQLLGYQSGKLDLIEVMAEQSRRMAMEGRRVEASAPLELVALVFGKPQQSEEDRASRDILALSIDRASIKSVLLQGTGDAAGGILPDWMTGYEFVFPAQSDLRAAQSQRPQARQPLLSLGFDSTDPLSRLLAERIVLNAGDAGIRMQATASNSAEWKLVRVSLSSMDPGVALLDFSARLGLPPPRLMGNNPQALFDAENSLLQTRRIIPLFHLPINYAVSRSVRNWAQRKDGMWNLANVFVSTENP